MESLSDENSDAKGMEDLTPEEARKKREIFLALAKDFTQSQGDGCQQIDSADAAMATLILPGG